MITILYKKIKGYLPEFHVILGYVALTLLMTYPVILHLDLFIGSSEDIYQVTWGFWWMKKSLTDPQLNPLYTYHIFYPSGVNLAFFTLTYFNSMFSIPLQMLFGLVTSYNLMVLFSFVMSGYGTYLLVKYLTGDRAAAFISGTIFAFSPFMSTAALGHMHVLTSQWIPLFVLYLIKTIREKNIKNAVFAAIFFVLTALANFEYALYISFFTAVLLFYYFLTDRKVVLNKPFIKRMTLTVILSLLLLLPLIYPMLNEWFSDTSMKKTLDGPIVTSADLLAFFTPSERHPILSTPFKEVYYIFSTNGMERVVFIGYTVLFLSIYSVLRVKNKDVKFWSLAAICFFILALGPVLHIFGRFLFPSPFNLGSVAKAVGIRTSELGYDLLDNFVGVPLPYLFLHLFFPFFSATRTPSRFSVMLMLSLAVLSGYAISKISKKLKNKKINFFVLFLSLIVFEFISFPFPSLDSSIPEFYSQIALDTEDYVIVEIPYDVSHYMYYQTLHGKKMVSGRFGRKPDYTKNFTSSVPLLRELGVPIQKTVHNMFLENIMKQNPDAAPIIMKYIESEGGIYSYPEEHENQTEPSKADVELLRQYNIKYIILHKKFLDKESFDRMTNMLKMIFDDIAVYEDGDIIVYKIY